MDYKLSVTVPFPTQKEAEIALKSLQPDPEVKPHEFNKVMTVEDNKLLVNFSALSDRNLRVGVNSFMDSLGLVVECFSGLSPSSLQG